MKENGSIFRYQVPGARRWSNFAWGLILCIGGLGFLVTGLASYFHISGTILFDAGNIQFFPQGLVMCFYGVLALLVDVYIWLIILWNLGEGFNEFNLETGQIRIFRWGFPGKNRRIDLYYPVQDVQSIRVEIQEGFNPKRIIYLCLRGNRQIPLTRAGQPLSLEEIESQAAELAKILQVSIQGI